MRRHLLAGAVLAAAFLTWAAIPRSGADTATPATKDGDPTTPPKIAPSRIASVTVYPNNALVTREVAVPEGSGTFELVVSPLPPHTVSSSLYSEGGDKIRVLSTRYRVRPIREDSREEVRKIENQIRTLQLAGQKIESEIHAIEQNLQMLAKLENFTSSTMQHATDKGQLNGEQVITLSKYVMESRSEKSASVVALKQQLLDNAEQLEFAKRKRHDLTAGSSRTEHDAVIVVDKQGIDTGKVRLNYLVDAASWKPQYKFRAGKDKEKVQVEYLAGVIQHTGEDWKDVQVTLSTAQPLLNACPPDLHALEVATVHQRPPVAGKPGMPMQAPNAADFLKNAEMQRGQAYQELRDNKQKEGSKLINDAAAWEQARDILVMEEFKKGQAKVRSSVEIPSITYNCSSKLTIPSRTDEHVIEVSKLEFAPEYYYKAVPVLTQHVYRIADVTNTSSNVLLPGEATMYIGSDFVGRASLPLVAVGEQFTIGLGIDPQLQVQRQMTDKTKDMKGENQVHKFDYRLLVSSFKNHPVKLQLWDRVPHSDTDQVGVSIIKTSPELCKDPIYERESKTQNLLRWDLTVEPKMNGEKALEVKYEFKIEMGRQMSIESFLSK